MSVKPALTAFQPRTAEHNRVRAPVTKSVRTCRGGNDEAPTRLGRSIGKNRPPVSHDTDKLIRQLSLVAFLMAERRTHGPGREGKRRGLLGNVRRVRATVLLGPRRAARARRAARLAAGRVHREELTRSARALLLGELELTDDELAALQTAFFLLEGRFAYAEPLRSPLQNLALGRPGSSGRRVAPPIACRSARSTTRPRPRGLAKLEGAISKQRTVKFNYHAISRNESRSARSIRTPSSSTAAAGT